MIAADVAPMHPVVEMGRYLIGSRTEAQKRRNWSEDLTCEVAQDIHADIVKHHQKLADRGYSAEQADLEAAKLLRRVVADGKIEQAEMPDVLQAIEHILNSAKQDHAISEEAKIS